MMLALLAASTAYANAEGLKVTEEDSARIEALKMDPAKDPLTGFGFRLAEGVMKEVEHAGILGIFTGGIKSAAAGITAAVFFAFISALFANPKEK